MNTIADYYDEIQTLKGIDYYIGMGGTSKITGKATSDKVYSGGLGENYLHQVFHIQVEKNYPNKHFWVSEGIATFIGECRGKELKRHIKRPNEYLTENPEIDLNNLLQLKNLDEFTSYHIALGGLIAENIIEKGGWTMIIDLMNSGKTDSEYYNAIEKNLGIRRKNLNVYLREEVENNAEKKDLPTKSKNNWGFGFNERFAYFWEVAKSIGIFFIQEYNMSNEKLL